MNWKKVYGPPHVFVFMGVSGSGKSTIGALWARRHNIPFEDGDDFHPKGNIEKMSSGIPLNDQDRAGWLDVLNERCAEFLKQNSTVVLACSALKATYRERIRRHIESRLTFVYLKGSQKCIQSRLMERCGHFMPASLLMSQFKDLEEPDNAIVLDIEAEPESLLNALDLRVFDPPA